MIAIGTYKFKRGEEEFVKVIFKDKGVSSHAGEMTREAYENHGCKPRFELLDVKETG